MVPMRILIYSGMPETYQSLMDMIRVIAAERMEKVEFFHVSDYDVFRRSLVDNGYDLIIVAEKGARGMEVCIGARKIRPHAPLFWFSDDPLFAAQSYRLSCTYFGQLPVSFHIMENALRRIG